VLSKPSIIFARLAQWLEQGTHNSLVGDSNSSLRTTSTIIAPRLLASGTLTKRVRDENSRPANCHRRVTERKNGLNIWCAKFLTNKKGKRRSWRVAENCKFSIFVLSRFEFCLTHQNYQNYGIRQTLSTPETIFVFPWPN